MIVDGQGIRSPTTVADRLSDRAPFAAEASIVLDRAQSDVCLSLPERQSGTEP